MSLATAIKEGLILGFGGGNSNNNNSGAATPVNTAAAVTKETFRRLRVQATNGAMPTYNGIESAIVLTPALTPVAVAANTSAEQTFTVTGVQAGDVIAAVAVASGGTQTTGINTLGFRLVNATTIAVVFQNTTGASLTPYAGTYNVTAARMTGGIGLPYVTMSAAFASSSISNPVLYKPDSPVLRWQGTWVWDAGYGGNTYAKPAHVSYSSASKTATTTVIDFDTDAPKLDIMMVGAGKPIRVLVDGQIVTPAAVMAPNDGKQSYRLIIDFTQGGTVPTTSKYYRKVRRIKIEASNLFFGGVTIGKQDSIWKPSPANSVRAIVFGDSFVEALFGATDPYIGSAVPFAPNGFANQLGYHMGWDDCWTSGVGGTGYLAKGPSSTLYSFTDRVAADVIANTPDVLVVMGSVNDISNPGNFTTAQIQAAVTAFYQQVVAALPNTIIFVAGVQYPNSSWQASYTNRYTSPCADMNNAVKAGVAAVSSTNLFFIDMIGESWVTGSGNAGSPTLDGNADIITRTDNLHPTQPGHDFFGRRIASAIRKIIKQNA